MDDRDDLVIDKPTWDLEENLISVPPAFNSLGTVGPLRGQRVTKVTDLP
jgi:hypothetical protein